MTIERLREALSATGPPPDARELSEMLWLACHISPPQQEAPPGRPVPSQVPGEPVAQPAPEAPPAPVPPRPPEPLTGLHPPPTAETEPAGEASEVLVPTAPMLADPLGVQRALRPLKRRVPARHRLELDEDATAARIADTRRWTPVLVPSPERWLSLSLVVDTGPTMRLWRPLARELAETLVRQGAFQDVHVSYLDGTGRIASTPEAPPQDPGTLLDASGRQAMLVLSDCSGPHWWNGRAAQAVRRWAQAGPTAIVQPLAERLWRRTAAPATPGLAVLPRPGAPNTDLRFTPYDGAVGRGVPVPVLEIAPHWFGAWARLVSGSDPQPAAIATLPARPSGTAPVRREHELPIAERVRRFLATASPDAAELAAHVAVSVPSLPVMRLIQHRILGGSGPGQLAEVLLSGLLRPADGVRYEFVPGAREALLDTLPRPEALHTRHVLEAVSAEIERRAGTSAETFRALLPDEGGPVTLTTDTDHFALLTPETRTHLAPASTAVPDLLDIQGATVDELLGGSWDRPPSPAAIGVDDNADTVWLEIMRSSRFGPHGMITGPRHVRDSLLRTMVFGLALGHSPNVVTFAFADFSGGASFVGLGSLPHVTTAVHTTSADSPMFSRFTSVLETERRRREEVLRAAGTPRWDDYQAAIADGRPLDPMPALIVIVDNTGPLLEARPDLVEPVMALCEKRPAQGIRFVFCSPDEVAFLSDLVAWRIAIPGDSGTGSASLEVYGERSHPSFRPAHISLDASDPIVDRMRRRGQQASRLPWPPETPEPSPSPDTARRPATPEVDVLRLNGDGFGETFQEAWAQPASTPRDPAIGYDPDGNVVTLYPLDVSAGLPHGLIVGEAEARQHVVRNIALALAATYSPTDLTFAFAGLGDHPLGEPLDLPHVAYSDDELLGHPGRLRRFIAYLSNELDARAAARSADAPGLVVFADVSLTFPSSRPEAAEALLAVAQRGRALGVQLLISAETAGKTTTWDRFLPLLGWRIAASRRTPAELQRVLGRANLPFPDDRTAYLLAGGGTPRRFTLAPDPSMRTLNEFIDRADRYASASAEVPAGFERTIEDLVSTVDDPAVAATIRRLLLAERDALESGRRPRHLIFTGRRGPDIENLAREYERLLIMLGVLPAGESHTVSVRSIAGLPDDVVDERPGGPLFVLCWDGERLPAVRDAVAGFAERFTVLDSISEEGDTSSGHAGAASSAGEGGIPVGVEVDTGEPVVLDFAVDRHLLVSGPSGSGKAGFLFYLDQEISARTQGQIYFLDGEHHLSAGGGQMSSSGGDSGTAEEFDRRLREAIETVGRRGTTGRGPDVYLIMRNRRWLLQDDPLVPLLPLLRSAPDNGLRFVVSRHQISFGEPRDPVVETLRELGAPVLLTGYAGGQEADLWELPSALRGPVPRGHAVLARPDGARLIRLTTH
ncbi:hypothetical protein E1293_26795 [Actinomadura darangshiensis]|uniref:FtsK domain-containing protein n=1 Tax=Actinomadura darangshiensis TaxID=705336 RepID=A0A4R5AUC3_9ACTN|nr:SAV_2336 N-terminal domain-related protein [Actinomadura darangshiensis]TDD76631.1 hypothetical protein E1293_26795 [Actinomadura darangshiensis]